MPKSTQTRIVLHIDMDAFFAAIEERDHPEFHGFPIVVGADPKGGEGRGVVSTANYKARIYGVGSAQPISHAWRLCKAGEVGGGKTCIFFGGNFEKYEHESEKIMNIISRYSSRFEPVSVDEAYIELAYKGQSGGYEEAEKMARNIRREILRKTKLTCSIGIGPNKLVAKIASDFKKPDGLTVIHEKTVQNFLDPMPVRRLPGIGPKADTQLSRVGIRTIQQLRLVPQETLQKLFGKWGIAMHYTAHGQSDDPVGKEERTKSIGREETFDKDTSDAMVLIQTLKTVVQQVVRDITRERVRFKTVELKIRFSDFVTATRARTLEDISNNSMVLERTALTLFLPFLDHRENPHHKHIRLIGIRVSTLVR